MSLRTRILLIIISSSLVVAIIAIAISSYQLRQEGIRGMVVRANTVFDSMDVATDYVHKQDGLRKITEEMLEKFPDGKLSDEAKKEVLLQAPIYAAMVIGSQKAKDNNYEMRWFSDEARNPDNQATVEEMEIFKKFEADPKISRYYTADNDSVRVYRAGRLWEKNGCFTCHGDPATSPWGNGKDVLGYQMENWRDGKLHAIFELKSPMTEVRAAQSLATRNIIIWSALITLALLIFVYFLLKKEFSALLNLAQRLRSSGTALETTAKDISSSSQVLSSAATQAAASILETTSATEEINSTIQLNANHADNAKSLSSDAQLKAEEGMKSVHSLVLAMSEIANSSEKVEEIISVINDIAFQTNLLALNATVEAARAGEHGKSFAVVADAVRTLAQKSSGSADEINALLAISKEKVQQGQNIAKVSGESLDSIVKAIKEVSVLNTDIAHASSEQTKGVNEINQAINEIDKMTQQNAESAEFTAATSKELSTQSIELLTLVQELEKIILGK